MNGKGGTRESTSFSRSCGYVTKRDDAVPTDDINSFFSRS